MAQVDEWGFPIDCDVNIDYIPIPKYIKHTQQNNVFEPKYKIGDIIAHPVFGQCEIFKIEKMFDRYYVKTENEEIKILSIDGIDDRPKKPHIAPIVAGIYKKADGTFNSKEYFFKDRINDGWGGLQVGDIGLAYSHKSKRCIPIKVTRIGISAAELKKHNVDRSEMVFINYKGDENYGTKTI